MNFNLFPGDINEEIYNYIHCTLPRTKRLKQDLFRNCEESDHFHCGYCSFWERTQAKIIQHTEIQHYNNKGFSCPRCWKHYRHRSGIYTHLRYECGVEPQFHCHICQHKFRQKTHLVKHLKTRHSEKSRYYSLPNISKSN